MSTSGHRDEKNLRQLPAADRIGCKSRTSDIPSIVRMVSRGYCRRSIEAWTKSTVDEKPGGGTEGIAHNGFERIRTIAGRRLPGDICWSRHVRGAIHPSRCVKASVRKNTGGLAASFQKQSSSFGFAPRGADARSSTNLVQQTGCIPSEPAGIGAFSNRSVVEAGKSVFAKT